MKQAVLGHSFERKRRAFSLIEMAIVVGIIGAILAGIFAAASLILYRNKVNEASDELYFIANNVRNLYAGRQEPASGSVTPLTGATYKTLFPYEMVSTVAGVPVFNNPWNLASTTSTAAATVDGVAGPIPAAVLVSYSKLSATACSDLLVRNSLPGRDNGLLQIAVNGSTIGSITTPTTFPLPINPITATTSCNITASSTNTITWYFQLNN